MAQFISGQHLFDIIRVFWRVLKAGVEGEGLVTRRNSTALSSWVIVWPQLRFSHMTSIPTMPSGCLTTSLTTLRWSRGVGHKFPSSALLHFPRGFATFHTRPTPVDPLNVKCRGRGPISVTSNLCHY